MASTNQTFKWLLDPWQWIGIEMVKVYAKMYTAVLLSNQHYGVTPHALAGANSA